MCSQEFLSYHTSVLHRNSDCLTIALSSCTSKMLNHRGGSFSIPPILSIGEHILPHCHKMNLLYFLRCQQRFTDCTATRTVPRQVLSDNNSACRGSVPVALVSVERTVPRQIFPISILIRFKVSSIKLTDFYISC